MRDSKTTLLTTVNNFNKSKAKLIKSLNPEQLVAFWEYEKITTNI